MDGLWDPIIIYSFFAVTRPVTVTYLRIDGPICQLHRRSRHRIICAQDHREATATHQ